jgi:hypothetical protein
MLTSSLDERLLRRMRSRPDCELYTSNGGASLSDRWVGESTFSSFVLAVG